MSSLVQLAVLPAAVALVLALAVVFARNAVAAAWMTVAVFALAEAIVPAIGLQVTVGTLTVYAMDVVVTVMFVIGIARLASRPNPTGLAVPLWALSLLFVLHALWGIASFGLQDGVNGARSWFYLLGPLVFASQAVPQWTRKSFLPLIVGAVGLSLFALASIAQHGLYAADEYITVRGEFVDARPVMAKGALLIVQCVFVALAVRFARPGILWFAVATMGATALLLQYRTIWIVALVVAVIAYTRWARPAIFVNRRAALGAVSALLFAAPVVLGLILSSSAFAKSVNSATAKGNTLNWRWESWTALLDAHSSLQDRILGVPAGTPLNRTIGNIVWNQSPHSLYVDALLSLGAFGVVALVYLWIVIVRRRRRAGLVLGIGSTLVGVIILSQAIYGIANMLDPVQGLLLGILLQAAFSTSLIGEDAPGAPPEPVLAP